jgi:hypothetical protein
MSNVNVEQVISIIAAVISSAVKLGPTVIKTEEDAAPFAKAIYGLFTDTNVAQAQLDELVVKIKSLSAQLQNPLPEEDPA